jgi:hypothetical protein
MNEFPIRRVDRGRAQSVEPLGSKPKFWFRDDDKRRLLFKADDRGTGEDWAEVIACHLCGLLGLPHVEYELATECAGSQDIRPGVICENMAPPPASLVLGNQLLLAFDPQYPTEQRFKVKQHAVETVCDIVTTLELPPAEWMAGVPDGIESALDVFAGYVMLDAWIANQDRHHENWAALWDGSAMRLAPTFDHGAGLARNLLDSERQERLTTKDRNRTVAAFAQKGRSAFFGSPTDARPLELLEAFYAFAKSVAQAAKTWQDRLAAVNADAIQAILERVPARRMSEICKRFTLELLLANQHRLLE